MYSALGIVTLSRTIFGFLSLTILLAPAAAEVSFGAAVGLVLAVTGAANGFATFFAATVRTAVVFFVAAGRFAAALRAGAARLAGARFLAAAADATGTAEFVLAAAAAWADGVVAWVIL
jgi:hypothetical protein